MAFGECSPSALPVTSSRTGHKGVSTGCQAAVLSLAVWLWTVAMALGITRILIVLSILQLILKGVNQNDEATQQLLQQHKEQQRQEVAWFLKQLEEESFLSCRHWSLLVAFEALLIVVEEMLLWCQHNAEAKSL